MMTITTTTTTTSYSHVSYDELISVTVGPNGRRHVTRCKVSISDLMAWEREHGGRAVVTTEVPVSRDTLEMYEW